MEHGLGNFFAAENTPQLAQRLKRLLQKKRSAPASEDPEVPKAGTPKAGTGTEAVTAKAEVPASPAKAEAPKAKAGAEAVAAKTPAPAKTSQPVSAAKALAKSA